MPRSTPRIAVLGDPPPAPAHLSPKARGIWKTVVDRYDLDELEIQVLAGALSALDLHDRAMRHVRKVGVVVTNKKTGAVRQNPALSAANSALRSYSLAVKRLGLGGDDPPARGSGSRRAR